MNTNEINFYATMAEDYKKITAILHQNELKPDQNTVLTFMILNTLRDIELALENINMDIKLK